MMEGIVDGRCLPHLPPLTSDRRTFVGCLATVGPVMEIQAEYWFGQLPLEVVDGLDGPTNGITRIYVRRGAETMVLSGFDNYWVAGDRFGIFNDEENFDWYEGEQSAGYRWPEGENAHRDDSPIPAGAKLWRGVMLPDDEAKEVGLL